MRESDNLISSIIALYCLMKCHEAMGEVEQVKENIENISRLIGENDLSREMYSKYGEMMKDFTPVTETHPAIEAI